MKASRAAVWTAIKRVAIRSERAYAQPSRRCANAFADSAFGRARGVPATRIDPTAKQPAATNRGTDADVSAVSAPPAAAPTVPAMANARLSALLPARSLFARVRRTADSALVTPRQHTASVPVASGTT